MAYVNDYKEVLFNEYCCKCIHEDKSEHEPPCDECIAEPVNLWSKRPIKFEEKETGIANG